MYAYGDKTHSRFFSADHSTTISPRVHSASFPRCCSVWLPYLSEKSEADGKTSPECTN